MNSTTPTNSFHIYSPRELHTRTTELRSGKYLIQDLIPKQSISLVVGKSGEGKSPLLYQASIAVAAGLPFLGRQVRQGKVLYLDCENGLAQVEKLVTTLSEHMGLEEPPQDLRLWNLNDSGANYGQAGHKLEDFIREERPIWVIIDPLKTIFPRINEDNALANAAYTQLRKLGGEFGCAFTGVNHPRKPSNRPEERPEKLEKTVDLREWFNQSRGSQELINGCDVRIGVEKAETPGAAIIVRGFGRVEGEFPPLLLAREEGQDGKPRGYRLLNGEDRLNGDQAVAFQKMPPSFKFSQAMAVYGRTSNPTNTFLIKLVGLGLIHHDKATKIYHKVSPGEMTVNAQAATRRLLTFPEPIPAEEESEPEAA